MNWQEEVAREMKMWGFQRGRYNPCLYWQKDDDLMTMVHGDDFVSVGSRESTGAFKRQLEQRFEIKTQVIGSGSPVHHACVCTDSRQSRPSEEHKPPVHRSRVCAVSNEEQPEIQEGRVLNRIIRWTNEGWEIEPDQRHAAIIVHELGLSESKPVSTPGET